MNAINRGGGTDLSRWIVQSAAVIVPLLILMLGVISQVLPVGTEAGMMRLAHYAVRVARLDVYLDGELLVNNLSAGTTTEFFSIRPGAHWLVIVPSGRSISQPLFDPLPVQIEAHHDYSAAVIGQADAPTLKTLVVDETALTGNPVTARQKLRLTAPDGQPTDFQTIGLPDAAV